MKKYIKPQFELLEYSFDDIIAASGEAGGDSGNEEVLVPDLGGDDENLDNF